MKTLIIALLLSASAFGQAVSTTGNVSTVGGVIALGVGTQVASDPHGIYMAFPPTSPGTPLTNCHPGTGTNEWCLYTEQLINGTAAGVGNSVIGGAVLLNWSNLYGGAATAPTCINGPTCVPSYDFTSATPYAHAMADFWTCNGDTTGCPTPPNKQVGVMIANSSYSDPAAGSMNAGIPALWSNTISLSGSAGVSRAGNIIHIHSTSSNLKFLIGTVVGPNPANGFILGTNPPPDGQTQGVQVSGSVDLNGFYPVCDHNTSGCSDPTLSDIYVISQTSGTVALENGAVGNPIFDLTADKCGEGGMPLFWSTNFVTSWQSALTAIFTTYGSASALDPEQRAAWLEPGYGMGFENYPYGNISPSSAYVGGVPSNCRAAMNTWGYGGGAAFSALTFGSGTHDPTGLHTGEPANCGVNGGCYFWEQTYLLPELQWLSANVIHGHLTNKNTQIALSPTIFGTGETGGATLLATNIVANGLAMGTNGLRAAELGYNIVAPVQTVLDNNAAYNFTINRGYAGFGWQSIGISDPTNACVNCGQSTSNGSITPLLPFAITMGGQILQPYAVDIECTIPGYDLAVVKGAAPNSPAYTISAISESGTTVTLTSSSTLTADVVNGSRWYISGVTPAGYNGSFVISNVNTGAKTFQYTAGSGLATGSGANMTYANDFLIKSNCDAAGYTAAINSAAQALGDPVSVAPSQNLQTLVSAHPGNTTFILQAGVHHDSVTSLKSGDVFKSPSGTTADGVIENGATTLTGWTQVTISGNTYWTTPGGTPNAANVAPCYAGYPDCYYPQDLYFDNTDFTHVAALPTTAGTWYWDNQAAGGACSSNPCSDGGTFGNIYLFDDPTGHIVELGSIYNLFQSCTATTITVEGLTIEKYAPNISDGAVEPLANGWVINNNEILLNHSAGVAVRPCGDGSAQGNNATVQNNYLHDNGYNGAASGSVTGLLLTGNTIVHNNIDFCANGGGYKGGNATTGFANHSTITYNTVYNNIGEGLWSDGQNYVTYDHNTTYNNADEGIRIEVSNYLTLTNNTAYGNGAGAFPSGDVGEAPQIDTVSSGNATISGNYITAVNAPVDGGIVINHSNRSDGILPTGTTITHNYITLNYLVGTSLREVVALDDNNGAFSTWIVPGMFDYNTYCVSSTPWTDTSWYYGNSGGNNVDFSTWQADGQDVHGTLQIGGCL